MKRSIWYLIILFIVSACGQRDVLVKNRWIFIGGTLEDKRIDFGSTERMVLRNKNGQIISWFNFNETERITLPGIHSLDISAKWKAEGNKISFSIDSMQYAFRGTNVYKTGDSIEAVTRSAKFKEANLIYGHEFEYSISLDTLRLFSKDVKLWAVRDNSLDDLLKHLKPRPQR